MFLHGHKITKKKKTSFVYYKEQNKTIIYNQIKNTKKITISALDQL